MLEKLECSLCGGKQFDLDDCCINCLNKLFRSMLQGRTVSQGIAAIITDPEAPDA